MKNIESFLPIFSGFYGTFFEPDETMEIDDINQNRRLKDMPEIDFEDCKFDYETYHTGTAKDCVNWVDTELNGILGTKIEVKFEGIYSPKFYNFSNDSINVTYAISEDDLKVIKQYLSDNFEDFSEYIKDHFTSYDGFISFHSNDAIVWVCEMLNEIEEKPVVAGTIFDFIIRNETEDSEIEMYMECSTMLHCVNYHELIGE